jgi:hypothetical protein
LPELAVYAITVQNALAVTPWSKYIMSILHFISVRPGCDMGYCGVFLSWGFVGRLRSLWLPEAVLNQSQVIFVVSDWEPYLGSHIL